MNPQESAEKIAKDLASEIIKSNCMTDFADTAYLIKDALLRYGKIERKRVEEVKRENETLIKLLKGYKDVKAGRVAHWECCKETKSLRIRLEKAKETLKQISDEERV